MNNKDKVKKSIIVTIIIPAIFFLMIIFVDQASKYYVVHNYGELDGQEHYIIDGFEYVKIRAVGNEGMIFGLFSDAANDSDSTRMRKHLIMGIVSILVLGLLIYSYRMFPVKKTVIKYGFLAIVAGAVGNMMDRFVGDLIFHQKWEFMHGKVIDFIYMQIPQLGWNWYIYNIADVAITCGAVLISLTVIIKYKDFSDEDIWKNDKKYKKQYTGFEDPSSPYNEYFGSRLESLPGISNDENEA